MVYPIGKMTLVPLYKLWIRKVEGLENIPKDRPFIFALNHSSYYDSLIVHSLAIPRINKKIHALVNSRFWDSFFSRIILEWGECIPVYVNNEKSNEESLKKALQYLEKGDPIQIFPEGTRSKDGKLQKAYNGVGKLAIRGNVPVLPVGIIGSNRIIPKGSNIPRLARCDVKFGKLMHFTKSQSPEQITRKVMKEIGNLIGQKYNY